MMIIESLRSRKDSTAPDNTICAVDVLGVVAVEIAILARFLLIPPVASVLEHATPPAAGFAARLTPP